MTNLTAEQIAGIKAATEGVTPGPWRVYEDKSETVYVRNALGTRTMGLNYYSDDAKHIANCDPQTISALCDLALRGLTPLPEGYALVPIEPTEATASEPAIDALREVDVSVLTAARDMNDDDKRQPAWIWHHHDKPGVNYGRWPRIEGAVPYIRADLVLSSIRKTGPAAASPAIPTARDGGDDDPDDPEGLLYSLSIARMGAPYSDVQGHLYMDPRMKPDVYRDAEFRDYGLARAVRIILNSADRIRAALSNGAQP